MKALLVDGLNLVRRIYAAVHAHAQKQKQTHAHFDEARAACIASLRRALTQHEPTHCALVLDGGGVSWRHELHPAYKQNRAPMPQELRENLARIAEAFAEIPVRCFSLPNFEADDVIATLAVKIAARDGFAVILSTDRNYCQLLGARIAVFDHFAQKYLDAEVIQKKFQAQPRQLPELLALAGDSGVSIAGVQSVGARTAAKLLRAHGNLEAALEAARAGKIRGKLGASLRAGAEDARRAKILFTLRTDLALGVNLREFRHAGARNAPAAAAH